ncbi:hypothetical protein [Streptomyces sp. NPDC014676]|uniref:hypothetical protein n=1 Tax=Streptomyces sp. NPDC014676 TaxID=3364879 RepID=UPI0036FDC973
MKAAGWIRGAGIVGSAGATAWGVANLAAMDHGKAWKEDKAEKAGEAISDGAKKLGSALNPFD